MTAAPLGAVALCLAVALVLTLAAVIALAIHATRIRRRSTARES